MLNRQSRAIRTSIRRTVTRHRECLTGGKSIAGGEEFHSGRGRDPRVWARPRGL